MRTRFAPLAAVLAVFLLSCSPRVVVEDYSTFERFVFTQESGLGFCPDLETPFTATIDRAGAGELVFSTTVLSFEPDAEGECLPEVPAAEGCAIEVTRPPRTLSSAEAAQVAALFAEIDTHPEPDRRCKSMGIDPCRILRFTWDETEHTDFVCSTDRLTPAAAEAMLALIGALGGA